MCNALSNKVSRKSVIIRPVNYLSLNLKLIGGMDALLVTHYPVIIAIPLSFSVSAPSISVR
jgi:hypothetical protein